MKKKADDKHVEAVEWVSVGDLIPWDKNPRVNAAAVGKVAESLRSFGFVSPVVAWRETRMLVAGHTRRLALLHLMEQGIVPKGAPGPGLLPVRFYDFASKHEAEQYAVADNKLGEIATWDEKALGALLGEWGDVNLAALGMSQDDVTYLQSLGEWVQSGAAHPSNHAGYDSENETFVLKIQDIAASDKDLILEVVSKAIGETKYKAALY